MINTHTNSAKARWADIDVAVGTVLRATKTSWKAAAAILSPPFQAGCGIIGRCGAGERRRGGNGRTMWCTFGAHLVHTLAEPSKSRSKRVISMACCKCCFSNWFCTRARQSSSAMMEQERNGTRVPPSPLRLFRHHARLLSYQQPGVFVARGTAWRVGCLVYNDSFSAGGMPCSNAMRWCWPWP